MVTVTFKAKVAVGLSDSVAVLMLEEKQIDGNKSYAVNNDMEADTPADWFHHLQTKLDGKIGIYEVEGGARFSDDSAEYYDIKVIKINKEDI